MYFKFTFHDVREGGFLITRDVVFASVEEAKKAARKLLDVREFSDQVDVSRYLTCNTAGLIEYVCTFVK